jgi:hypothetical protein
MVRISAVRISETNRLGLIVIITSLFLKYTVTIHETMPLPLQFCRCLRYAIMYAWRPFGPTVRCIQGTVYSYGPNYPCSDFSFSISHFTNVWVSHVSASSTSRRLCMRRTQGPDWREEAPRLVVGAELAVKLPQMLSLAKGAFPAAGIRAVKEELERKGRCRFPLLRRSSPAPPTTTRRRGRSII